MKYHRLQTGGGRDVTEEQLIKMAAKLYEMRDFCKRLNPDMYSERIAKCKRIINEAVRETGLSTVKIVVGAMTDASNDNDHATMAWIGAAFLELYEEDNS